MKIDMKINVNTFIVIIFSVIYSHHFKPWHCYRQFHPLTLPNDHLLQTFSSFRQSPLNCYKVSCNAFGQCNVKQKQYKLLPSTVVCNYFMFVTIMFWGNTLRYSDNCFILTFCYQVFIDQGLSHLLVLYHL